MLSRLERYCFQSFFKNKPLRQYNMFYIDYQRLRIITPFNIPRNSGAWTYSNRRNNRNSGNQMNYYRLLIYYL